MIEIEGLSDLTKNLDTLARNAQALDGEHHLNFGELFPDRFMSAYTDFESTQEMLDASGLHGDTEEEIKAIFQGQEWNDFVARRTRFSGWEEMMQKAVGEWTSERLHRGLT